MFFTFDHIPTRKTRQLRQAAAGLILCAAVLTAGGCSGREATSFNDLPTAKAFEPMAARMFVSDSVVHVGDMVSVRVRYRPTLSGKATVHLSCGGPAGAALSIESPVLDSLGTDNGGRYEAFFRTSFDADTWHEDTVKVRLVSPSTYGFTAIVTCDSIWSSTDNRFVLPESPEARRMSGTDAAYEVRVSTFEDTPRVEVLP